MKNSNFKVYPVIVRANGREKKVLAVGSMYGDRHKAAFSIDLLNELGMCTAEEPYFVTISSLDDQQTIPITYFRKTEWTCSSEPREKYGAFRMSASSRSHFHNETERLWPHLFGPGQLSREEETVHVKLHANIAKALDCSALTTRELCRLPNCQRLKVCRPSYDESPRTGTTSDPKKDYYWLMDKFTYNIQRDCGDRSEKIRRDYDTRTAKRDKFIKSAKYLKVAEGPSESSVKWWNCFCWCCTLPIDNGK